MYFNDHADHQGPPVGERAKQPRRLERGSSSRHSATSPPGPRTVSRRPASTRYSIENAQIVGVPSSRSQRDGLQPTVGHRVAGDGVDQGEGGQAGDARRGRPHSARRRQDHPRPSGTSRATARTSPARSTSRSRIAAVDGDAHLHRAGDVLRERARHRRARWERQRSSTRLLQNIDRVRVVVTE